MSRPAALLLLLCCRGRSCAVVRRVIRPPQALGHRNQRRKMEAIPRIRTPTQIRSTPFRFIYRSIIFPHSCADSCYRLTREEREEAYNKARLRIFGTTAETETSSPGKSEKSPFSRENFDMLTKFVQIMRTVLEYPGQARYPRGISLHWVKGERLQSKGETTQRALIRVRCILLTILTPTNLTCGLQFTCL